MSPSCGERVSEIRRGAIKGDALFPAMPSHDSGVSIVHVDAEGLELDEDLLAPSLR